MTLLCKITPKNAMNFWHLFSCDSVEYWVYPEDFKSLQECFKSTCLLGGLFKQVHL